MQAKRILCLSDAMEDMQHFTQDYQVDFFEIEQISPVEYTEIYFKELYGTLKSDVDLSAIDLIVAEYVESLILVNLLRVDGFICPAIFIPHTNPYPLDIFCYFLLNRLLSHPEDLVLCGSNNAAQAYRRLLGINAKSICTFGMKDLHSNRIDKATAREHLGLPMNEELLLYTGRLMEDKGINELCEAIALVRIERPNVRLVISATHIESGYYNLIAPKLKDAILFYRLRREDLVRLYNSADLYVSCATSIYETYGKSQLEAIAAGLPVIVPEWDGFPHYINSSNGLLARVDFFEGPYQSPFQFCKVDIDDFSKKCIAALNNITQFSPRNEPWAQYSTAVRDIRSVVSTILEQTEIIHSSSDRKTSGTFEHTGSTKLFMDEYSFDLESLSFNEISERGIICREEIGSVELRKSLHHSIFNPDKNH